MIQYILYFPKYIKYNEKKLTTYKFLLIFFLNLLVIYPIVNKTNRAGNQITSINNSNNNKVPEKIYFINQDDFFLIPNYTISKPGKYIFAENIIFSKEIAAITITCSDVDLDFNGFSLIYSSPDKNKVSGIKINQNLININIKDSSNSSSIRNFNSAGIIVKTCSNIKINNLKFINNETGIFLKDSQSSEISNCVINNNKDTGILLDNCIYCIIDNNQLLCNKIGIFDKSLNSKIIFTKNKAICNDQQSYIINFEYSSFNFKEIYNSELDFLFENDEDKNISIQTIN